MKDRYKFRIYDEKRQFMISEKCDRAKCEEFYGFDEYYFCIEFHIPTILNYFDNYISINNNGNWDEESFVVMQCTGLKDKNGKLIYEGDIILIPNNWDEYGMMAGEKREIYFNEGGFRLKPKWDKNSRGNWLEDTEYFEVIGNIYQNPELLKD